MSRIVDSALGVEISVLVGLPSFQILGMAQKDERKWRDALRATTLASELVWPMRTITLYAYSPLFWVNASKDKDIFSSLIYLLACASTVGQPDMAHYRKVELRRAHD